ncbi:hypothetical protein M413DRAFT_446179 [Hebeloma cylindrosporum]|uniref:Uncharacterized protein n=1 Tax=Hebeloma cylindrosporum TaxID=76867 RepID=A0A0C2XSY9_HEBCY|nr:hypothetical protein M413DRAFT_446179 [Hebeloma cylindrosporum h7]
MSTPITRETFISPDHVKIAATHSTMYKMMPDGVVEEVPVPARVRKSGILLEGYTVDFVLDPSTIVATLKGNGLSTVEELPADMLKDMIAAMNDPKNLTMVPIELSKGVFNHSYSSRLSTDGMMYIRNAS